MELYTVADMKRAIRNGATVRVTSTVLLGGGISLKVSKTEINEWLRREDNTTPLHGDDGVDVYFDADTNTIYI